MTDDAENNTGAYSLDAVGDDERIEIERQLEADPRARAEADEFRATAARLGAAEAEAPPGDLKARVMGDVETTRQLPPDDATVVPLRHPRARLAIRVAAAAAAVVLIAAAAVVVLADRQRADDAEQIVAIVSDPATELIQLSGDAPEVSVRVVWSPSRGEAVVLGSAVPDPGADRAYELWLVSGDTAAPGLLFRPDAHGQVEEIFATDLESVDVLAVTEEPAGGSPAPTGDVLLSGMRPVV